MSADVAAAAIQRDLVDEAATVRLGEDIAAVLRPGDVLALEGDLGAGKTTLARGLIRALAGDPEMDVPSPTFTLVQAYEGRLPVAHLDLYRLSSPDELDELGLDEALSAGVAIIEWPDRAGDRLPADAIRIELAEEGEGRAVRIDGPQPAMARLGRSLAARDFLARAGFAGARRAPLGGDASARRYEEILVEGQPLRLLMDSPPLVLGPPVRDGKAYAEIAHTSRTVAAFVGMDNLLADAGVTVPEIVSADLEAGFLLIGHLGHDAFLVDGKPVAARYAAAAELLADMHARQWPDRAPVAPGIEHVIPPFDRDAMMIEVDLLLDWYIPHATGKPANDELRERFAREWNALFDGLAPKEQGILLRDFHSPNLIWRDDRHGNSRLGVLDFQDALLGPTAYDVASLALDARVTVPPDIERATVDAYVAARNAQGKGFDVAGFEEACAIMGAQRNSKILGIFVRLKERDGKPQYLAHLPRIRDYLARSLSHPALAGLAALYRDIGVLEVA
ncbi:MAG: tRNA (adenosine(37)-N6)-threonylcarbamoyltransferase complex ATPase subunit type 1 TsaE [Rhizobiaceae bacterium]